MPVRKHKCYNAHARIQKVLSEWVQLGQLVLADEGREDPNITINGPSFK